VRSPEAAYRQTGHLASPISVLLSEVSFLIPSGQIAIIRRRFADRQWLIWLLSSGKPVSVVGVQKQCNVDRVMRRPVYRLWLFVVENIVCYSNFKLCCVGENVIAVEFLSSSYFLFSLRCDFRA
jgi:hypothetical protein